MYVCLCVCACGRVCVWARACVCERKLKLHHEPQSGSVSFNRPSRWFTRATVLDYFGVKSVSTTLFTTHCIKKVSTHQCLIKI